MNLYELGVRQAVEGLASKKFSSVELVRAVIDRVHEKDGEIGAYLTFDEEGALAAARYLVGKPAGLYNMNSMIND